MAARFLPELKLCVYPAPTIALSIGIATGNHHIPKALP